jgi:hypothetical protein
MANKLTVELTNEGVTEAMAVFVALGLIVPQEAEPMPTPEVNEATTPDVVEEDGLDELDDVDDLLDEEEEPAGPTIEDVKNAYKGLIEAKGKEDAQAVLKKILTKLKAKKLSDVSEDRWPAVVSALEKSATA